MIVNEENRDLWATLSYLQRCLRLGLQARIVTRSPAPCHSSGAAHARRRAAPSALPRRSRLAEPLHQHTSSRASEPVRTLMATTPTGCKVHGLTPLAISEPDVGGLASAMLSPGTEELFAVACNMFLSPGKPLGGLTPVGRGGGPGSHLFAGLLPSPLPASAHGGAAALPRPERGRAQEAFCGGAGHLGGRPHRPRVLPSLPAPGTRRRNFCRPRLLRECEAERPSRVEALIGWAVACWSCSRPGHGMLKLLKARL